MDGLSKCHKFAMKEVLGAVGLLKSRIGVSARDIYFVLDHLHGKVQRPVINYALKAAVNKGLLNCVNNHYKLRRRRGVGMQRSRGRTVHKTMSRASRKSVAVRSRSVKSRGRRSRRHSLSDADYSGSDYGVPVRNYECSPARRPKMKRSSSRRTYRFHEMSSVESCSRCAGCVDYSDTDISSVYSDYSQYSSDPKPRKKVKKLRKYPMPKKIKVEKKSSNESEMNTDVRKSTKRSTRKRKGKASGNKTNSSAKGFDTSTIGAGTAALNAPQAGPSINNKYNLRPRRKKQVCVSQMCKKQESKPQTEEASESIFENIIQPPNEHN